MNLLSIVLPAYNEEENVAPLCRELEETASRLRNSWQVECLFVDDGSTDRTRERILEARRHYPELGIRLIALDANYGLTAALDAGFHQAKGEVVATLDADLQNDPADLPRLLSHLDHADVVAGVRTSRQDSWIKRVSSHIANTVRNRLTHETVIDTGCTLRVYRREFLTRLKLYSGLHRFLPTLLRLEGARIAQIPVHHRPRAHGVGKYHLLNRAWGPFVDLLAVRWMQKRHLRYRCEEAP